MIARITTQDLSQLTEDPSRLGRAASGGEQGFDEIYQQLQQQRSEGGAGERSLEGVGSPTPTEASTGAAAEVSAPNSLEEILSGLEANHEEMDRLVRQMEQETFSLPELIAIQKRMNELSISIEMGTKMAAQAVDNVNRVLTQQV